MALSIDSSFEQDVLMLGDAMKAFRRELLPLKLFSTHFTDIPADKSNEIVVPYVPLETSASIAFDGTYRMNGGTISARRLILDRRKYQPMTFSSADIQYNGTLAAGSALQELYEAKVRKLGEDIVADVLSLITEANFGAGIKDIDAADFDLDTIIEIRQALNQAKWPRIGRSLVLDDAYTTPLHKDLKDKGGVATFGSLDLGAAGARYGFDNIIESDLVPTTDNLRGFACLPSAILFGVAPIIPAEDLRTQVQHEMITDPDTGLTFVYRRWGDADGDKVNRAIECFWGRAVGEAAALKRIVDAD